ncbi:MULTISPECIES: hypothetical protein [Priestia]|uniref:hypothetical protein n=1 Tax=Priestia TaxID=2800373 RepID=UPI002E22E037|nr:hypothetical protein [Priestia aryabhattai]
MNLKSPTLILDKLTLVGRDKSYSVNFDSGLNIIYGDSDTGKSSILNLIDYLLGSKKIYMYDEIEQYGKYGLLQLKLNGKTFTIKRNIFNPKDLIEVYSSSMANMDKVFPLEYGPDYQIEGPSGYFSDFLLSTLNIPLIKVKKSPSKENSEMVRLGFRDIFKFCYFDQDQVGSRDILDKSNPSVFVKNKETFKFLHNALDTQITELQNEISVKNKEKVELSSRHNVISSFLLETKLSTEETLREKKIELLEASSLLENEIINVTSKMKADNSEIENLRNILIDLEQDISVLLEEKSHKEVQLEQNIRLKKDYSSDINKLKLSLKVRESLNLKHTHIVPCPLCNNDIKDVEFKEQFVDNNHELLTRELNSIRNRIKDLNILIEKLRDEIFSVEKDIDNTNKAILKMREALDINSEKFVSPFIKQRDIYVAELSSINEQLNKVDYFLKIRNQLKEISEKENLLNNQIEDLKKKLDSLKETAPSITSIINSIGTYLSEFLNFIPIKNAYGVRISEKTFLPIVRERDYANLTSGGLRTLVSIGYIISLLKNSLYTNTNYPGFIMLDTVGKYLGKTKNNSNKDTDRSEDKKELLDDPTKYVNIYKFFDEMSTSFIEKGIKHQIIIVDNDFPEELEKKYMKYVVKRFSVEDKEGFERGFINNANR